MLKIPLKFKKTHPDAITPTYAKEYDSGMDLCSVEDVIIPAGERKLIKTGIIFALPIPDAEQPYMTEIQIRPRSGLALKKGITVLNTPGTIDTLYRGEIGIILMNTSNESFEVKKGDRIAQAVVCPVFNASLEEVSDIEETSRGSNGFGSTGV